MKFPVFKNICCRDKRKIMTHFLIVTISKLRKMSVFLQPREPKKTDKDKKLVSYRDGSWSRMDGETEDEDDLQVRCDDVSNERG